MNISSDNKQYSSRSVIILVLSFILAISPVLDPYILGTISGYEIRVMYPVLIIFGLLSYCIPATNRKKCDRSLASLLIVLSGITLVSFILPFGTRSIAFSIRLLVQWAIMLFMFYSIISAITFQSLYMSAKTISVLASILVILQYLVPGMWDGRLPLELSKYDVYSGLVYQGTDKLAPHAFFQEPSYLAIYCGILLIAMAYRKDYRSLILVSIAVLISDSFIGKIFLIFTYLYLLYEVFQNNRKNIAHTDIRKPILLVSIIPLFVISLALIYALNTFQFINNAIDSGLGKLISISQIGVDYETWRSSAQYRILGNIELFDILPMFNKIFGVGANQASLIAGEYFFSTGYSSTLINTILNYGLFGLVCYIVWVIIMMKRSDGLGRVFLLSFVLILCIDNIWFNSYFFYLYSWPLLYANVSILNYQGKEI